MRQLLLRCIFLFTALAWADTIQAQTVTGTVTEPNGPLPGANVLVKGTTNGTTTDFDGNYTLNNVPEGSVLVFSYVGFRSQDVPVNGRSVVDVLLEEDSNALEEVVVIGYGQTTVKDATGAVSSVTSEDFNKGVISSPEQLIQGKTSGVQIAQNSGEPGAGVSIRIRGTSSIRSNNNPLFVVDGVPLPSGDTSADTGNLGIGSSAARNPLSFLNPSDIENISILKDASATAIYGSRGANGVVIITTKSGRGGSQNGVFEFSTQMSYAQPAEEFDLLNRSQFLSAVQAFGGTALDLGNDTDWQSYVTRNVASTNNNLAYSQNYGSGNVRATFNYQDQLGVIEQSSQERITGRINASQRLFSDKLRLTLQSTLARVNDEAPPLSATAGSTGDVLGSAYTANPTWPADTNFNPGDRINPINLLDNWLSEIHTDRFLINFSAEYDLFAGLSAKGTVGYDKSNSSSESAIASSSFNAGAGDTGLGFLGDLERTNRLVEFTLNYNLDLEGSKIDALVGYSFQDFRSKGSNTNGRGFSTTSLNEMTGDLRTSKNILESLVTGSYQSYGYSPSTNGVFVTRLFPSPTIDNIDGVNTPVQAIFTDTYDNTDELQSFFARVNYTIAEKYLFTATVRADGSSKFGPNNKYGYFPSGAFAWKINEEDFIGDNVSTLKLRLNYGITGSQDGLDYGRYLRQERYTNPGISADLTINQPGITSIAFVNPDLKWEETTQYGAGIDFGFNNDRFNGTLDVYRKENKDLLLSIPSAQPAAQPFVFQNLPAKIVNEGIELSLNYDILQGEDYGWNVGINAAYNKNEIQDFDGQIKAGAIRGSGLTNAFAQQLEDGQPLYSFYLRVFEGFDESGNPIFEGGIDNQQFVGKSALPDVTGGFSTSANYKNWDAALYFNGQFGNYIYNNTANAFFTAGQIGSGNNVTEDVVELVGVESPQAEASVSTRFLEKGDFVRLQTASIGYNVPLSGEGVFKSMRLSLTGQNLFVITGYSGLDPEVSTVPATGDLLNGIPIAGVDYSSFPRPRIYSFGFNVTF